MTSLDLFLSKNKEVFGSHDGLPGEFHRKVLFEQVRPGKTVGIVTPQGSRLTGRVVMRSSDGQSFALNMGGRHGRPGVLTATNCIFVARAKL